MPTPAPSQFEQPTGCLEHAHRGRLGCYGLAGGKSGQPFAVTVDVEGRAKEPGGLVDGELLAAGQLVRVVTTGGGGWGDPLDREPELVRLDVWQGKVSLDAAREDYGVVLESTRSDDPPELDFAATEALRSKLRSSRGELKMLDRGARLRAHGGRQALEHRFGSERQINSARRAVKRG